MKNFLKEVLKEYQFIVGVILALVGIIGLEAFAPLFNKSIKIIPWLIAFSNQYSGVLLLILILISFNLARKQSIIRKKLGMLSTQSLTFVSDEQTIFIGSNTNKALPSNVKAVATQIHPAWHVADSLNPELRTATWIADRKTISNDEAVEGGQYTFARDFDVPFDLSRMRSAKLSLLVDDYCEVMVNETRFGRVEGFKSIHTFDIGKAVKKGINHVQFSVENMNFRVKNNPNVDKAFFDSKEKGLMNPYGFKFSIVIEYFG